MELIDNWLKQIPPDGNAAEITKQEILTSDHCRLSGHLGQLCTDRHGRDLKMLFEHPWPDREPGPSAYLAGMIQGLSESIFELLEPLSRFAYLQEINKTYPKKAPLHDIRRSLLRDQAEGYQAFRQLQEGLKSFWSEHVKPLKPGRSWQENERRAMESFFQLIQTKTEGLIEKIALGSVAMQFVGLCGDSSLSGHKLNNYASFLRDIGADLRAEFTKAMIEIGRRIEKARGGEHRQEHRLFLEEVLLKIRADRRRAGQHYGGNAVWGFIKREIKRGGKDQQNPLRFGTESGADVCLWFDGKDPNNEALLYCIEAAGVRQHDPIRLKSDWFIRLPGVFEKPKKTTP